MQKAVPHRHKILCALNLGCSCAADGSSAEDDRELADALQRVREQLHSTQSSAAVCLICLETMHNDDAVWHCSRGCCCVLHLLCIQAWSRQQVAAAAYSASQESARYCDIHVWAELLIHRPHVLKRQGCMRGLAPDVEGCVRTSFALCDNSNFAIDVHPALIMRSNESAGHACKAILLCVIIAPWRTGSS